MSEIKKEGFFKRKLVNPLLSFLKQGVSPEKLALAIALGAVLGVFPMIGATTTICAVIAFSFRLNMAAIQLINYFMYPLQLLLYIPFFKAGSVLFGAEKVDISIGKIFEMFKTDVWGTIKQFWWANVHAVVVWLIVAPFAVLILYFILMPIFRKLAAARSAR